MIRIILIIKYKFFPFKLTSSTPDKPLGSNPGKWCLEIRATSRKCVPASAAMIYGIFHSITQQSGAFRHWKNDAMFGAIHCPAQQPYIILVFAVRFVCYAFVCTVQILPKRGHIDPQISLRKSCIRNIKLQGLLWIFLEALSLTPNEPLPSRSVL